MPQQEGEVVVDGALPVMQVGMADPASLDPHQRLAGARVRHKDVLQLHGGALCAGNHSGNLVRHRLFLQSALSTKDTKFH